MVYGSPLKGKQEFKELVLVRVSNSRKLENFSKGYRLFAKFVLHLKVLLMHNKGFG